MPTFAYCGVSGEYSMIQAAAEARAGSTASGR